MSDMTYQSKAKTTIPKKQPSVNTTTRGHSDHDYILQLQRTLGNQATQKLMSGEAITFSVPSSMPELRMPSAESPTTTDHSVSNQGDNIASIQRSPLPIKQKMTAQQIARKKKKMHLDFVRMKRKKEHIGDVILEKMGFKVKDRDQYGHWWVEVGDLSPSGAWQPLSSYGWWPSEQVNLKKTFKGVPGALNRGDTNDPHHGDGADDEFHPVMTVDDKDDYDTIRNKVEGDIENFANGFSGSWNWRLGWGKNCHTFQMRMKKALHLHHQKSKHWLKDPEAGNRNRTSFLDEMGTKDPVEMRTVDMTIPRHRMEEDGSLDGAGELYIGQEVGFTDLTTKIGGEVYHEVKTEGDEYFWVAATFVNESFMWA